MVLSLFIRFGAKDIKYDLDTDVSLDYHVATLCQQFNASGNSSLYGLQISSTFYFLENKDLKKDDKIANGALIELKLKPTTDKAVADMNEVQKFMEELQSTQETTMKNACFQLRNKLKDEKFSKEFKQQNGVPLLKKTIDRAKGNTLAYALQALEAYMGVSSDYNFLGTSLMERILSCVFDSNINVTKSALRIVNLMTRSDTPSKGAVIFMSKKKDKLAMEDVLALLENADATVKVEALNFVNNLVDNLSPEEVTEGSFERLLVERGIDQIIQKQIDSKDMKVQIARFQHHRLWAINQERLILYEPERPEHEHMLKRLWAAVFPDEDWQGPAGEHWKQMGFQGKRPETDFRAAGIMGLKHLLYISETYGDEFREIVRFQNTKEALGEQYPVCAAGINVSIMLMTAFGADKKEVAYARCQVYPFLFEPNAYEEVYCAVFRLLNAKWIEMKATYMQFQNVITTVRGNLEDVLRTPGLTIEKLAEALFNKINDDSVKSMTLRGNNSLRGTLDTSRDMASDAPRTSGSEIAEVVTDVCDRCTESRAIFMCADCGDLPYCENCNGEVHAKGKWRSHQITRKDTGETFSIEEQDSAGDLVEISEEEEVTRPTKPLNLTRPPAKSSGESETSSAPRPAKFGVMVMPQVSGNSSSPSTSPATSPRSVQAAPRSGTMPQKSATQPIQPTQPTRNGTVPYPTTQSQAAKRNVAPPTRQTLVLDKTEPATSQTNAAASPPTSRPVTRPQARPNEGVASPPPARSLPVPPTKGAAGARTGPVVPAKVAPKIAEVTPKAADSSPKPADPAAPFDREKAARLRAEVINEIITTERDYVSDLNVIVEVFLLPIKLKGAMPTEDVNIVFSNVETLVNCNTQVIRDWDERKKSSAGKDDAILIGEIFDKLSPFFKMYSVYCANQPNAMIKLQEYSRKPEFLQTLKICSTDPRAKGLSLNSFLIKPIQRICKYPLLFRELIKQIDPADQERFQTLVNCMKKIEQVTEYINEGKRLAEKLQRIVEIQNSIIDANLDLVTISRRFVREGNMMLSVDNGENTDNHIFLFNDLFVITKERKKGYELKGQVSLEDARIVNIADTDVTKNALEVSVGSSKYTLSCPTAHEKTVWLKELKALKKEFQLRQVKGDKVTIKS
eukprot:TRINITY_DN1243_c0_g1_i1.p1 TRINITY_DN1243_c0_g1~~TRINITY_DN1243_c0_g1_i1.p1  ORF type:complete len:1135 (-),score=369.28 TRINITY_DN1243_c0_g1_i1:198-3602(-)